MKNKEISNWWAENPMTYGKEHGTTKYEIRDSEINFGSKRFFEEADKRFIDWNKPLHKTSYFSAIFPFEKFKKKKNT